MCTSTLAYYSSACEAWDKNFSFFPKTREGCTVLLDTSSAARNICSAASSSFAASRFIAGSSCLGLLGNFTAIPMIRDGYLVAKRGSAHSDREAVACGAAIAGMGGCISALSTLLGTDGIMTFKGQAVPASFGPAFGGLASALYGLVLGFGAYGLFRTREFRKQLNKAIEQGIASDWIRGQVTLTEEEAATLNEEEKKKLLQKKWSEFEFRTNPGCGKIIRAAVLKGESISTEEIGEVLKANFKESFKHGFFILIGLLGMVASLCGLFLTGSASSVMFAVCAFLWVGVDLSSLHNYLGEKLWERFSAPPKKCIEEDYTCVSFKCSDSDLKSS